MAYIGQNRWGNKLLEPELGPNKGSRRKSSSNLYKGMNVSKALTILKMSDKEYKELSQEGFREAFAKRRMAEEQRTAQVLQDTTPTDRKTKKQKPVVTPSAAEHKKMMEKNMKIHEAFQFLVKRRSASRERDLSQQESCSSQEAVTRSPSCDSWTSQDLGLSEAGSPAPKRRGSVFDYDDSCNYDFSTGPLIVGPGTPPPINLPEPEEESPQHEIPGPACYRDLLMASAVGIRKVEITKKGSHDKR